MTGFISVFITTASCDEAEIIARAIVDEKLAGCAVIMPGAMSVYRWQGKVEQAEECVLIVKTSAILFDALDKRVRQLHTYDCPCIVATPISAGNDAYLTWLAEACG